MARRKNLQDPGLYINRELSLLAFNQRVLALGSDPETPLLERVRFLAICSRNLDEFFEVRVAGLRQQIEHGLSTTGPDGLTPREQLKRISQRAHQLVSDQYQLLNDELLPTLESEGIRVLRRAAWTSRQRKWLAKYFRDSVLPVLSPIGLDPAHPFPRIFNKALTFVVSLEGQDAFGRGSGIAVVRVPRSLPRLITLPDAVAKGPHDLTLLSSVIHANVGDLFPGMRVTGCFQFRVTRNSDLWVDEEEVDDLLHALKGELADRHYGAAVRLEVADNCPPDMTDFLLAEFHLGEQQLYRVNGPVNLNRLMELPSLVDRPDLKYPQQVPGLPTMLQSARDMFEVLRREDVLLHHPFEAFTPVVELLKQAASDPNVVAIKQTLYRTSTRSKITEALIEAARNGKEVTVVVEIKARFDEAANIALATSLQDAGANVVYGIVGHKTHAKMLLVVRREGTKLQHYAHVGTGNYHTGTARLYTDFGLMTSDPAITGDVQNIFSVLTGLQQMPRLRRVLHAPFTLHKRLLKLIDDERKNARKGKSARIIAKMNSLTEPSVIQALYRASQSGVEIDLIVRGICCLRPGVPGVSETIRVRSIVGRFLEHSRVLYFHADGEKKVFIASADWMGRNLFRRVETCVPVLNAVLKKRVIQEALETYLADNTHAWELDDEHGYKRTRPGKRKPISAQSQLIQRLGD